MSSPDISGRARRVDPNSLAAFESVDIGRRQAEVLDAIDVLHRHGRQPCDTDVAAYLRFPISWITPRRRELIELGHIIKAGNKDGCHGRKVSYWAPAAVQLSLFTGVTGERP